MEKITRRIDYWIFKKTRDDSDFYFIRKGNPDTGEIEWIAGVKGEDGKITQTNAAIDNKRQQDLEVQWKKERDNEKASAAHLIRELMNGNLIERKINENKWIRLAWDGAQLTVETVGLPDPQEEGVMYPFIEILKNPLDWEVV